MSKVTTWRISGDCGDAIFQCALMHALGGKHIVRCVDRPGVTSPWTPRVPLIKKLFESQPYIEAVEISEEDVDVDLVLFRRFHSSTTTLIGANLAEYQMRTLKFLSVSGAVPWMSVEPDLTFEGKVIIARSPRYNNGRFDWKKIVDHYGPRLIFIGLQDEHQNFVDKFGNVPHLRTETLYDVARIVAGSSLAIMNQSSPHAVAMAMGKNIIQECDNRQPDCIYPRENVQYVADGEMILPDISGSGTLYLPKHIDIPMGFSRSLVPPGMWQASGLPPNSVFELQARLVSQKEGVTLEKAEEILFIENARRVPQFFNGTGSGNDPMDLFHAAMRNAGLVGDKTSASQTR